MARKKTTKSLQQTNGKLKTSSSTAKTKRKTKAQEVEQIHGKVENEPVAETVKKSQALDKILGMRQKNPFNADSLANFEQSLKGKNLTDLRELAVSAGIFPSGNPTILRKKLIKGFEDFMRGGDAKKNSIPVNDSSKFPNSDLQKKIDDIWSNKK